MSNSNDAQGECVVLFPFFSLSLSTPASHERKNKNILDLSPDWDNRYSVRSVYFISLIPTKRKRKHPFCTVDFYLNTWNTGKYWPHSTVVSRMSVVKGVASTKLIKLVSYSNDVQKKSFTIFKSTFHILPDGSCVYFNATDKEKFYF